MPHITQTQVMPNPYANPPPRFDDTVYLLDHFAVTDIASLNLGPPINKGWVKGLERKTVVDLLKGQCFLYPQTLTEENAEPVHPIQKICTIDYSGSNGKGRVVWKPDDCTKLLGSDNFQPEKIENLSQCNSQEQQNNLARIKVFMPTPAFEKHEVDMLNPVAKRMYVIEPKTLTKSEESGKTWKFEIGSEEEAATLANPLKKERYRSEDKSVVKERQEYDKNKYKNGFVKNSVEIRWDQFMWDTDDEREKGRKLKKWEAEGGDEKSFEEKYNSKSSNSRFKIWEAAEELKKVGGSKETDKSCCGNAFLQMESYDNHSVTDSEVQQIDKHIDMRIYVNDDYNYSKSQQQLQKSSLRVTQSEGPNTNRTGQSEYSYSIALHNLLTGTVIIVLGIIMLVIFTFQGKFGFRKKFKSVIAKLSSMVRLNRVRGINMQRVAVSGGDSEFLDTYEMLQNDI